MFVDFAFAVVFILRYIIVFVNMFLQFNFWTLIWHIC